LSGNIFSQDSNKNYTEISPTKAALILADRQTDNYEVKWRLCESQGKILVALIPWGEEAKYVLLPANRSP
jgi:hypothetical protein